MLSVHRSSPSDLTAVEELLANCDVSGASVLGERKHLALQQQEIGWVAEDSGTVVGLLQTAGAGRTFEIVARDRAVAAKLVRTHRDNIDGELIAWSKDGLWDQVLIDQGFWVERVLLRMSAPLPIAGQPESALSFSGFQNSFAADWIEVNNDAFAGHNEQGGWVVEDLNSRQRLGWWDAAGLRIGWSNSAIAAYCWTKVAEPGVGEIYAVGVGSQFQGRGYGGAMTAEGLRHLHQQRGCHTAVLYVDGANSRAVRVYERLGFAVEATDRSFSSVAV